MDTKGRLIELSDGSYVDHDTLRIVEKIREYDPSLVVKYLNSELMDNIGDAPWAIFETCKDGIERLVFTTWELDDRVIERIYNADNQRHNIIAAINNNNENVRKHQKQRFEERSLELKDIVTHVFDSSKGRYSFDLDGKHVEIDDDPNRRTKVTEVD